MRAQKSTILYIAFLIATLCSTIANCKLFFPNATVNTFEPGAAVAQFRVLPGIVADVGDELVFDASNGIHNYFAFYNTNKYEWDFGDGFSLMNGKPNPNDELSGISCSHFFLTQGNFKVTLKVTSPNGEISSSSKQIIITGLPHTGILKLAHADFHGHTAQYIYASIRDSDMETGYCKISIKGDNGYYKDLFSGILTSGNEAKILLRNSELPRGNYIFLAQLTNAGKVVDEIKEKFEKPYNSVPHIGINEDNAILVDGIPFFPVTPWLLGIDEYKTWMNPPHINSLFGEGYYETHTPETWNDYCISAYLRGLISIGPERWLGKGDSNGSLNVRNSDINFMRDYIESAKNNPGLFMWMWGDEPNMGGRGQRVPAQVLRSWTSISHTLDPHHLVATNLYGYDFLPYYAEDPEDNYNYRTNAASFGGRNTPIFDVLGFDIYPYEYYWHPSFNGDADNTHDIEDYCKAIDSIIQRNHDLFPVMSFMEVCDVQAGDSAFHPPQPGPTPEQLRMLLWINITHNIKGINWFPYFNFVPATHPNFPVMAEFTELMSRLGPIVLGPPSERIVDDNSNARYNRIDTLVKETATEIWIFAVRVTESTTAPGPMGGLPENPTISTTFTISGMNSGTAIVINDGNRTVNITGGTFIDTFDQYGVHLYKIRK